MSETWFRSAEFSKCETFRFNLVRVWAPGSCVMWIMLNPSTADVIDDDPDDMRKRLMRHPDEDTYIREAAQRAEPHDVYTVGPAQNPRGRGEGTPLINSHPPAPARFDSSGWHHQKRKDNQRGNREAKIRSARSQHLSRAQP